MPNYQAIIGATTAISEKFLMLKDMSSVSIKTKKTIDIAY
jgi:hypothetical protein